MPDRSPVFAASSRAPELVPRNSEGAAAFGTNAVHNGRTQTVLGPSVKLRASEHFNGTRFWLRGSPTAFDRMLKHVPFHFSLPRPDAMTRGSTQFEPSHNGYSATFQPMTSFGRVPLSRVIDRASKLRHFPESRAQIHTADCRSSYGSLLPQFGSANAPTECESHNTQTVLTAEGDTEHERVH